MLLGCFRAFLRLGGFGYILGFSGLILGFSCVIGGLWWDLGVLGWATFRVLIFDFFLGFGFALCLGFGLWTQFDLSALVCLFV